MPQFLEDVRGNKLPRDLVEKIAYDIIKASMTTRELIEFYISEIPDSELIEWAADENGEFPNEQT